MPSERSGNHSLHAGLPVQGASLPVVGVTLANRDVAAAQRERFDRPSFTVVRRPRIVRLHVQMRVVRHRPASQRVLSLCDEDAGTSCAARMRHSIFIGWAHLERRRRARGLPIRGTI